MTAFLVDQNSTITPHVNVTVDSAGAPTFNTVNSSGTPVATVVGGGGGGGGSNTVSRSASQLAGTPSGADVALGATALFYDPLQTVDATHPWVYYSATSTAYVKVTAGSGAATGTATPQALGIAAAGTATAASHEDHIHALPTAAQVNALGLPLNWRADNNTPALASGTSPTGNNAYVVTVAGTTALDGISNWGVGDIAYFGGGGTWQRIAAPPQTGTALTKSDGAGGFIAAVPGVDYIPGPVIQTAVPIGIACTGSVANNGVLTLGTAYAVTYNGGIWLYFPAGALYSGSLVGFYFVIMSSTTVGQVYTSYFSASTAVMGATGTWNIPASPVALNGTTGPGAYTGSTSVIFVPGAAVGILGAHFSISAQVGTRSNNNANSKTAYLSLGNATANAPICAVNATSTTQAAQLATMYGRGATNAQIVPSSQDTAVFGLTTSGLDTTQPMYVGLRLNIGVATDNLVVEFVRVTAIPQP